MRMYFFVPYNLSDIQKAIQAGHCALEYASRFSQNADFQIFMKYHKTWVILNGGTTMDMNKFGEMGSLNKIESELRLSGINYATFREPDLNNALTAVCFLADERVYDRELVPDLPNVNEMILDLENLRLYQEWVNAIGGEQNAFPRNLITGKSLA